MSKKLTETMEKALWLIFRAEGNIACNCLYNRRTWEALEKRGFVVFIANHPHSNTPLWGITKKGYSMLSRQKECILNEEHDN